MNDTITIQEVRKDLAGFFKRLATGTPVTVIAHSKPVIIVSGQSLQPSAGPKGKQHFLAIAEEARKSAQATLDPDKSSKELYHDMLDEKYGLRRR